MKPLRSAWALSAAFAAVYIGLDVDRYVTYRSGADLGLFTQTIASAFHGFSNTVEGGSHFTFHFSPILYLCAPALWLAHSAVALLVLQACAAALVAPALFLLARRRVPERLALWLASVALLYPPLAGVAFSDFHENGFAPAATVWLLWAVDARRWSWAALFVATTLAIKEDQAPILAFASLFALAYFSRRGERAGVLFALGSLVACLLVFAGFFAIVRPLAGSAHAWEPLHFYARSFGSHSVLGRELLGRVTYLLEAFVPICLGCFLSPALLLALPGFAELLLSRDPVTFTMGQHYAAVWIGYVLAAFVLGVARAYLARPVLAVGIARTAVALCVVNLLFLSPTHWSHYLALRSPHDATLDAVLARLPPRIDVGTHDEIFAHLGFDPNASLGLRYAPQHALVDETQTTSYWVGRMLPVLREPRSGYRMVSDDDGVLLYGRTNVGAAVASVIGRRAVRAR